MLNMVRVLKPWQESGALNAQINLYGFWNNEAFLTKSGDLGFVLRVRGVDYESLDQAAQEYAVKRLEAALKIFGPGFHIYQYLFKTNRPDIPFENYDDPVIQAAVGQRKQFFGEKLDSLYEVEILYAIVLEGTRSKTGIAAALKQLPTDPTASLRELRAQFSNDKLKVLLREQIEADLLRLEQRVHSFIRQLAEFVQIDVLQQDEAFRFFRRLLNYDRWCIEGRPQSGQFLDFQVANSDIEAERDHLRVGNHFVRVLTMKEAVAETKPMVLKQLLEIQANFCIITEWAPIETTTARKEITMRKRHFNISKFRSHLSFRQYSSIRRHTTRATSSSMNRSRRTSKTLATAYGLLERGSRWAISRLQWFLTRKISGRWTRHSPKSCASLLVPTGASFRKPTTSSTHTLPLFPAITATICAGSTRSTRTTLTSRSCSLFIPAKRETSISVRSISRF